MISFVDEQFDFLKIIKENKVDGLLAEQCLLQWPHFSWEGSENVKTALIQLVNHCVNIELVFYGNKQYENELTFLYKLEQKQKPVLWCGFWLTLVNSKIEKIKLIFDSFEYFEGENQVNIFGFTKLLANEQQTECAIESLDIKVLNIIKLIKMFFLSRYGFPVQDTPFARYRLAKAALEAKSQLAKSDNFRIALPFFSANEKGPIQFYATIVRMPDFSLKIVD